MKLKYTTASGTVYEQESGTIQELIEFLAAMPDEVRNSKLYCCGTNAYLHLRSTGDSKVLVIDTEELFDDEEPLDENEVVEQENPSVDLPKYQVYNNHVYITWEELDPAIDRLGKKVFADYPVDDVEFNLEVNTDGIASMRVSGSELGMSLINAVEKFVEEYDPAGDYESKSDLHINGTSAYTTFSMEMSKNIIAAALEESGLKIDISRMIGDEIGIVLMGK